MTTQTAAGDVWGRNAAEESDTDSRESFDCKLPSQSRQRDIPPESPGHIERVEAPDLGRDDSQLLYASVSKDHLDKKRLVDSSIYLKVAGTV